MSVQNIKNQVFIRKFINIINDSIRENDSNPIMMELTNGVVERIDYASPYTGSQVDIKYPPYTNVVLKNRITKSLNISLESSDREFQLKTSMIGINVIIPSIIDRYVNKIKSDISAMKTTAIKLSKPNKIKTLTGISALGGKLDYYIYDSDDLKYEYNKGILSLTNGIMFTPEQFSSDIEIYFILNKLDDKYIMEEISNFRYETIKKNVTVTTILPSDITNVIEMN